MLRFCKTNVILYVALAQNAYIFVCMCRNLYTFLTSINKEKRKESLRFIKYTNTNTNEILLHPFLSPILDLIHNTF